MSQSPSKDDLPAAEKHLRLIRAAAERVAAENLGDGAARMPQRRVIEELQPFLKGYELIDVVSSGSQGHVVTAVQRSTGRLVAVKAIANGPDSTADERERFRREVTMTSRLEHPGIVRVYDGQCEGRYLFCIMQFIDGMPLDTWLGLRQPPLEKVVDLFIQIAEAASYAHQRGIIHRDLKPANVLVDDNGATYILDFGLGRTLVDAAGLRRLSMPNCLIGTFDYLSPEQASGQSASADVRSDIHAIGLMMYRGLTGRLPYPQNLTLTELCTHIAQTPHLSPRRARSAGESPPLIPDDLDAIVRKATALRAEDRYQSAAALADDLRRFASGEAVQAKGDQGWYVLAKTMRRYRRTAAATAIAIVIITTLGAVSTVQWMEARLQRRNAVAAAEMAHQTLSTIVNEIDTHLEPLAGGNEARRTVLGMVKDDLEALAHLVERDESLADVHIQLMQNLGHIAYVEGRNADAREHLLGALDRLRGTQAFGDGAVEARLREVRIELALARATEDCEPILADALAHATSLAASTSSSSVLDIYREVMAVCLRRFCQKYQYADAVRLIEKVPPAWEPAGDSPFASWQSATIAADYLSWKGEVLVRSGRADGALTELTEAMKLRDRVSAALPANAKARHLRMSTLCQLASIQGHDQKRAPAASLLEQAVADGRHLVQSDPSCALWTRDLANALHRLSRLRREMGDAEVAFAMADEAVRRLDGFAAPIVETREWNLLRSGAIEARGVALILLQRFDEAFADLATSNDILHALYQESPDDRLLLKMADIYGSQAYTHGDLGNWEAARQYYLLALEIRTQLVNRNPGSIGGVLTLAQNHTDLAEIALLQDSPGADQEAEHYARMALALIDDVEQSGRPAGYRSSVIWRRRSAEEILCRLEERKRADARRGAAQVTADPHSPGRDSVMSRARHDSTTLNSSSESAQETQHASSSGNSRGR